MIILKSHEEYEKAVREGDLRAAEKHAIQEYILGTRYYLHYFYSPIKQEGYKLSKGTLEMLGIDRRDESNIDEMYKLGAQEELKRLGLYPTFVVTGNIPLVLRESLLPKVFEMGEQVVEKSLSVQIRQQDEILIDIPVGGSGQIDLLPEQVFGIQVLFAGPGGRPSHDGVYSGLDPGHDGRIDLAFGMGDRIGQFPVKIQTHIHKPKPGDLLQLVNDIDIFGV